MFSDVFRTFFGRFRTLSGRFQTFSDAFRTFSATPIFFRRTARRPNFGLDVVPGGPIFFSTWRPAAQFFFDVARGGAILNFCSFRFGFVPFMFRLVPLPRQVPWAASFLNGRYVRDQPRLGNKTRR